MFDVSARRTPKVFSTMLSVLLAMAISAGLTVGSLGGTPSNTGSLSGYRLAAEDDEVVLPGRVAGSIGRTMRSVDRAEAAIDDGQRLAAITALASVVRNLRRAGNAAMLQVSTAAPVDEEAEVETTAGPDSVVAVTGLAQTVINRLSGLFDGVLRPLVISWLGRTMTTAHNQRMRILNVVIGLDPEGAGVPYADGMADTVDSYADEVATLTEALDHDQLTTAARASLVTARTRSVSTQTKVTTAFGGGE
jgi:hypothetical protein